MPKAGSHCGVQTFSSWCNSPTSSRPAPRPWALSWPPRPQNRGVCCTLRRVFLGRPGPGGCALCTIRYGFRGHQPGWSQKTGAVFSPYCTRALNTRLKVKCLSRNLARRESKTEDPARPTHSLKLSLSCAHRRVQVKKGNAQDFRTFSLSFLAAVLGEERVFVVDYGLISGFPSV